MRFFIRSNEASSARTSTRTRGKPGISGLSLSGDALLGVPLSKDFWPPTYLATLGRKPGAPDHAPVFRDWTLPACFSDFRAAPEGLHGALAGARRFARILQLLGEHPPTRVRQAAEGCRREHLISADAVVQR